MLDTKTVMFSYVISNILIIIFIAMLWYQNRKRLGNNALIILSKETASRATLMTEVEGILAEKRKNHLKR